MPPNGTRPSPAGANRDSSPTAQVPKLFGPIYATASREGGSDPVAVGAGGGVAQARPFTGRVVPVRLTRAGGVDGEHLRPSTERWGYRCRRGLAGARAPRTVRVAGGGGDPRQATRRARRVRWASRGRAGPGGTFIRTIDEVPGERATRPRLTTTLATARLSR
jgi:hypothetical protein